MVIGLIFISNFVSWLYKLIPSSVRLTVVISWLTSEVIVCTNPPKIVVISGVISWVCIPITSNSILSSSLLIASQSICAVGCSSPVDVSWLWSVFPIPTSPESSPGCTLIPVPPPVFPPLPEPPPPEGASSVEVDCTTNVCNELAAKLLDESFAYHL